MARDLVFGNGRFYVAMDRRGMIRELCWPVVGSPNHLAGRKIRLGVWRNDWFSWLDHRDWEVLQWYEGEVGVTEWRGFGMVITRRCRMDGVVFRQDFECTAPDEMVVYQAQDLRIGETDIGDTCLHHAESEMMMHFKNDICVGFAGRGLTGRLDQVACGMNGVMGLEGTWRDAEDGHLSGKPIEQGSVDSVFGIRVSGRWSMPIIVGRSLEEVALLGNDSNLTSAPPLPGGDGGSLVTRSELIVRANTGEEGRVVAAIDSDIMENNRSNYAYVWMRDAVLTAGVMGGEDDLVGFVPECDTGRFLWQKYHPTGHRGSTWHPWAGRDFFPYQMDETALLVSYAYRHGMVDERVEGWLQLLVDSIGLDGLPRPSWDLWEERFGVHFWTCATVVEAFRDGGKGELAEQLIQAMVENFQVVDGRIPRKLGEVIADSSVLASCLWCEGLRPYFLDQAVEMVEQFLRVKTKCGGVARYEWDYYCRVSDNAPGNPWVICTMWLARAYWIQGRKAEAEQWLIWAEGLASKSGMLSEQYHPDTREPMSVCPLTWSHAEYLESVRLIRG